MKPVAVESELNQSLASANWLQDSDRANVALALRLATAFDVACDSGDIELATKLWRGLLSALEQLQLTPSTRTKGKQDEQSDGSNHIGNYLRLVNAADSKPKPKSANGRASSSRPRK